MDAESQRGVTPWRQLTPAEVEKRERDLRRWDKVERDKRIAEHAERVQSALAEQKAKAEPMLPMFPEEPTP